MTKDPGIFKISRRETDRRLALTVGHTLGDIDTRGVLSGVPSNKGCAGAVFEQSVFGYPPNSTQKPDLMVDGVPVELKVTGLVATKGNDRGWKAKEPMSITAVTPDRIVGEEFYTSTFWDKAEHLLVVYYLYVKPGKGVRYAQWATFEVKGYEFHVWEQIDIVRLENDWTIVRDFVKFALDTDREKELPNLSTKINPKLLYLDTSPKFPHSPRFRIKRTVVDGMAAAHFKKAKPDLPSIRSMGDLEGQLARFAERFASKSVGEIAAALGMKVNRTKAGEPSKSIIESILVHMFTGHGGKMSSVDLFRKASIEFKSIILNESGGRTEDMKLEPSIDFDELLDPDAKFEDSAFAGRFIDGSIVCAVFKEPFRGCSLLDVRLLGFKRAWLGDLEDPARQLWDKMRALVFEGRLRNVPILTKDGRQRFAPKTGLPMMAPNWPKSRDGVVFVRGTGTDARDKTVEINGVRMYRQNVWIKGTWIVKRLAAMDFLVADADGASEKKPIEGDALI